VLLSVPISYHFIRLYSATGRACRRKWRYIKYTPLPFTFRNTYDAALLVSFPRARQIFAYRVVL